MHLLPDSLQPSSVHLMLCASVHTHVRSKDRVSGWASGVTSSGSSESSAGVSQIMKNSFEFYTAKFLINSKNVLQAVKKMEKLGVAAYAFNCSPWEAEAGL